MLLMVDLVMDLLDMIAMEAASIRKLEGKELLTVAEINTGARLVLRESKDGEHACRPFLEMNLVRYASLKYTQYMACIDPLPPSSSSVTAVMRRPGPAATSGVPPFLGPTRWPD